MNEKMSKSRGNVISPEEIVYGVYAISEGFGFLDDLGQLVDFRKFGVWRDSDGHFYTSRRTGMRRVFLTQFVID